MLSKSLCVLSSFFATLHVTYAIPQRYGALPVDKSSPPKTYTNGSAADTPLNFYLVTSTSSVANSNSTLLPNATALSLFDPYNQKNYWLRTIDPGYASLPTFNLTDGRLATISAGPHNFGSFVFNSSAPANGELEFYAKVIPGEGQLGIQDGHLLTVGGEAKGWQLCTKSDSTYLGQTVLNWKSNSTTCTQVYVQAVAHPPY